MASCSCFFGFWYYFSRLSTRSWRCGVQNHAFLSFCLGVLVPSAESKAWCMLVVNWLHKSSMSGMMEGGCRRRSWILVCKGIILMAIVVSYKAQTSFSFSLLRFQVRRGYRVEEGVAGVIVRAKRMALCGEFSDSEVRISIVAGMLK